MGVLRVTQAFLPLLRGEGQAAAAAAGPPTARIVNIGSQVRRPEDLACQPQSPAAEALCRRVPSCDAQSGTVAYPLFGGYSASKFGLEAISDCLRCA